MSDPVFPRTLRIGILVFDAFEPLDVWGFTEAFSIARFIGTGYGSPPPYPFEVVLISNERKAATKAKGDRSARSDRAALSDRPAPVKSYNGPSVAPDYFRDQALEESIDVLMIPGGSGVGTLLNDPKEKKALLEWVRKMDQRTQLTTSVCTGAAILAASGLLDGKPATSNHQAFGWVTTFGPLVHWDNVSRWVDAGRYVTSAGVSAGTDMAFYLVKRLAGRAVAEVAATGAEYGWHRNPEVPIYYPEQAAVPSS